MAYIQPNSEIYLIKNCPLEPDMENTIYFSTKAEQSAFFVSSAQGMSNIHLTNHSFVHKERGVLRAEVLYANAYDVNYMMFKNTSFGAKWFYAFVTDVTYVNNETVDIHFTIDPMQTWITDFTPNQCFVEREHSTTDVAGDNLQPEPVDTGEMVQYAREKFTDFIDERLDDFLDKKWYKIYLVSKTEITGAGVILPSIQGRFVGGNFTTLYYYSDTIFTLDASGQISGVNENTVDGLNNMLTILSAANRLDDIVDAFVFPGTMENYEVEGSDVNLRIYNQVFSKPTTNGGYTPKNKKLLTYPYCYLECITPDGKENTYRYEFFNQTHAAFNVMGTFIPNPEVVIYPVGYNMSDNTRNLSMPLSLDNFPKASIYVSDHVGEAIQRLGKILATAGLAIGTGVAGAGINAKTSGMIASANSNADVAFAGLERQKALGNLNSTFDNISDKISNASIKSGLKIQGSNSSVAYSLNGYEFLLYRMALRPEFARMIDEYLSMFGYATRRVKTPNMHVRQKWTYVKTVGCTINGSVPADDEKVICGLFDKGIRFWDKSTNLGNYGDFTNNII